MKDVMTIMDSSSPAYSRLREGHGLAETRAFLLDEHSVADGTAFIAVENQRRVSQGRSDVMVSGCTAEQTRLLGADLVRLARRSSGE
ncbi:hypothetical protein [Actinomyces wuliandei]|uniref:hypothetical protein n=1 Tax=Actinomyces wuliandei TaxID=2057743 RepID=UPI000FD767F4|nr:hypothetical protein [Actinomyces wuliandei]